MRIHFGRYLRFVSCYFSTSTFLLISSVVMETQALRRGIKRELELLSTVLRVTVFCE